LRATWRSHIPWRARVTWRGRGYSTVPPLIVDETIPLIFPPELGISASQRLWSEEVALAITRDGEPIDQLEVAYEFSNGRRFYSP
jgi:hypothetical protein